jgi:ABC-type multidrug transport system permease subunit
MKHSIAKSILILILVVSLLTIGITAVMSVYEAEIFVRETMISKASNAAQVISHVYSGVFPETMISDEAVGAEVSATFQNMIENFQLEYLYIVIPDEEMYSNSLKSSTIDSALTIFSISAPRAGAASVFSQPDVRMVK